MCSVSKFDGMPNDEESILIFGDDQISSKHSNFLLTDASNDGWKNGIQIFSNGVRAEGGRIVEKISHVSNILLNY